MMMMMYNDDSDDDNNGYRENDGCVFSHIIAVFNTQSAIIQAIRHLIQKTIMMNIHSSISLNRGSVSI